MNFGMMFRNEVTILTQLNHPHIIKLYEFYEDRHFLYAVSVRKYSWSGKSNLFQEVCRMIPITLSRQQDMPFIATGIFIGCFRLWTNVKVESCSPILSRSGVSPKRMPHFFVSRCLEQFSSFIVVASCIATSKPKIFCFRKGRQLQN